jgi:hypothetical protein
MALKAGSERSSGDELEYCSAYNIPTRELAEPAIRNLNKRLS